PKKIRKKYDTPQHPWERARMEEESVLIKEYGLKNKREIWRLASLMRKLTGNAKKLITSRTKQSEVEKLQLLSKLQRMGLLAEGSKLEDVLSLNIRDLMERRLQSIVFKKGFARSMKQARQFITHQHVMVGDKKIAVPSYLVLKEEEATVNFTPVSGLLNPDHPERKVLEKIEPSSEETKEQKKPKKRAEKKEKQEDEKAELEIEDIKDQELEE
ncbi:30S ribosomal protein S4, partial [Candidatus Woesearchaeota archaeon]|nr:30S ribosomal protein S4 [Candidatus Woesearchaeota archaeon]